MDNAAVTAERMTSTSGAYPGTVREEAYQTWRSESGRRSLRKVADITGIPFGTLASWSRTDGWVLRARDDDDRDRSLIRRHAEMRLVAEHDILIDRLLDLSAEGGKDDKVKLDATKHALALLGHNPVTTPADAEAAIRGAGNGPLTQEQRDAINAQLLGAALTSGPVVYDQQPRRVDHIHQESAQRSAPPSPSHAHTPHRRPARPRVTARPVRRP